MISGIDEPDPDGGIARNELLHGESGDGDHGQPSVLDLGRLHPMRVDLLQTVRCHAFLV